MSSFIADFLKRLFMPPTKAEPKAAAKPKALEPKPMTPERAQLIAQAMDIYRQKQGLLKELSPVQKEALAYMALKTFFGAKITEEPISTARKPGGKKT